MTVSVCWTVSGAWWTVTVKLISTSPTVPFRRNVSGASSAQRAPMRMAWESSVSEMGMWMYSGGCSSNAFTGVALREIIQLTAAKHVSWMDNVLWLGCWWVKHNWSFKMFWFDLFFIHENKLTFLYKITSFIYNHMDVYLVLSLTIWQDSQDPLDGALRPTSGW